MAAVGGQEHEVWILSGWPAADGGVLLGSRVHPGFVFPAKLAVKQPDYAIVLQLFSDRPYQNRAHRAPPNRWISTDNETRKFSMECQPRLLSPLILSLS